MNEKAGLLRAPAARYVIVFSVAVAFSIAVLLIDSVDRNVVQPFSHGLAAFCALLINLVGGDVAASGVNLRFVAVRSGVQVANGCNAVEASLLLAIAILVFPTNWRSRLIGAPLAVLALQAFNLVRIISLLYLNRYSADWFEFFHLYLWDAAIMLDALLLFFAWHYWQSKRAGTSPDARQTSG